MKLLTERLSLWPPAPGDTALIDRPHRDPLAGVGRMSPAGRDVPAVRAGLRRAGHTDGRGGPGLIHGRSR